MGSMNMQCELNLYSTFLKKVLFQQLRFIPALAAAWYLHQFLLVADRTGINPVPTAAECCNAAYIQCRGGLYALPQKMSQPI